VNVNISEKRLCDKQKKYPINGKRNEHGIPLVRIKVMGKEGWKEIQQWVQRQQ